MKYFFIVQGEGMGHTTQSLALRSLLEKNGHTVDKIFLGRNFSAKENQLLRDIPHEYFYSPAFLRRSDNKGISLPLTFIYNLLLVPVYIFSILRLARKIKRSGTDAVVVFYDMIGQLGSFFSFSGKPVYSISHHFFLEHPAFSFPADRRTEAKMLRMHSWISSVGARKKLALSFTREQDLAQKKLFVVPPLLRQEILNAESLNGSHIHIYCLQPGFLDTIISMAKQIPQKEFRVFFNELLSHEILPPNIQIFTVSGKLFLESIRTSGMIICTAGFETLAEAIYLDKPLMVVPSGSHFEQYCNAIDAERVGAAKVLESFIFSELPFFQENPAHLDFMKWIGNSEGLILKHLTE